MFSSVSAAIQKDEEQCLTNTVSSRWTRASSPGAEALLGKPIEVPELKDDAGEPCGFVCLVDYMGNDATIAETARTSYTKGTRKLSDDAALVDFLTRHDHTTPLESCEARFIMKAPLFVVQQILRQRTANINQESLRYSEPSEDRWAPEAGRCLRQSQSNKQGSAPELVYDPNTVLRLINETNMKSRVYTRNLANTGLAREVSRLAVNVATFTILSFKLDAHNLGRFMEKRLDQHAQIETRGVASVMWEIMKQWLPVTTTALMNHRINAMKLSADEIQLLVDWNEGRADGRASNWQLAQMIRERFKESRQREVITKFTRLGFIITEQQR